MVRGPHCALKLRLRGELAQQSNEYAARHVLAQIGAGNLLYAMEDSDGMDGAGRFSRGAEHVVTSAAEVAVHDVTAVSQLSRDVFELALGRSKGKASIAFRGASGERDVFLFGTVPAKLASDGLEAALDVQQKRGRGKGVAMRAVCLRDGHRRVHAPAMGARSGTARGAHARFPSPSAVTCSPSPSVDAGPSTPLSLRLVAADEPACAPHPALLPITAPRVRAHGGSAPDVGVPSADCAASLRGGSSVACAAEHAGHAGEHMQQPHDPCSPVFTPLHDADALRGDAARRHKRMREDAPGASECALDLSLAWAVAEAASPAPTVPAGTSAPRLVPFQQPLDRPAADKVQAVAKAAAHEQEATAKAAHAAREAERASAAATFEALSTAAKLAAKQHAAAVRACIALEERLDANRREKEQMEAKLAIARRERDGAADACKRASEQEHDALARRDMARADAQSARAVADAATREKERLLAIAGDAVAHAARAQLLEYYGGARINREA